MGSGAGIDGLERGRERGGAQSDLTVAAEVSLAVAAKAAAENFPVALRLLPRRYRAHLTALYGFARLADELGDADGRPPAHRLEALDWLADELGRAYAGRARHPLLVRLQRTLNTRGSRSAERHYHSPAPLDRESVVTSFRPPSGTDGGAGCIAFAAGSEMRKEKSMAKNSSATRRGDETLRSGDVPDQTVAQVPQ